MFHLLTSLHELYLAMNDLSGTLPDSLGELTCLTDFEAYQNNLSGTIPFSFGNWTLLVELYLELNNLSGSIPPSLGRLTALRDLVLFGNPLNGSLPSSLGDLSQLQTLQLYDTNVGGSLPSSLGSLMHLHGNNFSGEIPSSFGQLSTLQYLTLYGNSLTGGIPRSLGGCTSLVTLILFSNALNGSIPPELVGCTSLTSFSVANNALTGSVPTAFASLPSLQYLFLYGNDWTSWPVDLLGALGNKTVVQFIACLPGQHRGLDASGRLLNMTCRVACNDDGTCTTCHMNPDSPIANFSDCLCSVCVTSSYRTDLCTFQCVDCDPGTFGDGVHTECTNCAAGSFSNAPGQSACSPCAVGTFQKRYECHRLHALPARLVSRRYRPVVLLPLPEWNVRNCSFRGCPPSVFPVRQAARPLPMARRRPTRASVRRAC